MPQTTVGGARPLPVLLLPCPGRSHPARCLTPLVLPSVLWPDPPPLPMMAQAGHALPILWASSLGRGAHGGGEAISALTWASPKPASLGALFCLEENSHFSL